MSNSRAAPRTLAALAAAAALAATAPVIAEARPALDVRPGSDSRPSLVSDAPAPAPVARPTSTGDGDQTLALVFSGVALPVAIGGAGYAGRLGRRTAQLVQSAT